MQVAPNDETTEIKAKIKEVEGKADQLPAGEERTALQLQLVELRKEKILLLEQGALIGPHDCHPLADARQSGHAPPAWTIEHAAPKNSWGGQKSTKGRRP